MINYELSEEDEDNIDDMYDSNKDNEYHLPGISNDYSSPKRSSITIKNNNSSPNIFNFPIGKFLIEDNLDSPINVIGHSMINSSPTIIMSQPSHHTSVSTSKTKSVKKKIIFSQPSNLTGWYTCSN
ncbi:uncharacterized protein LOC112685561 [Sipha flava]|uniref:Uncharacterized protein LOC112685561 n=1 Tax=Sipha flava TaxID=143950 RepID=A0A8B8FSF3_9HEMI|nr:uncharacterized protein LOC112685561 [Sipha flava]